MIEKTARALGRNDETPNIDLALELITTKNIKGIKEIVDGVTGCSEPVANDCIKVLYEIGEREPSLIAEYVTTFISLLRSKNNRLVWGAMTALSKIAFLKPREIFAHIDIIIKAYENGSVITVDNSITVFAELVKAGPDFAKKVFPLLIRHLETCRPKEVGQHAERAFVCVTKTTAGQFADVLTKRRDSLTDPQKKRVDRLLKRVDAGRYGS